MKWQIVLLNYNKEVFKCSSEKMKGKFRVPLNGLVGSFSTKRAIFREVFRDVVRYNKLTFQSVMEVLPVEKRFLN